MILNRQKILDVRDLPTKDVPMEAWDGTVRLRKLSANERMRVTSKYEGEVKGEKAVKYLCEILLACIVDEDNKPCMDAADLEALAEKDWDNLKVLADEAMALNGFSRDAVEDAKKN